MTNTGFRLAAVLAAGLLAATGTACSFSASSRSSSRSSSASSRSSSGSSSARGEKEEKQEKKQEVETSHSAFQEEIAAIAVLYVGSSGTAEDFQRDISAAAKRNGVPYWELDERVFTAIGIGLKRAGISREAIPETPFLQGVRGAALFDAIGNAYGKGD